MMSEVVQGINAQTGIDQLARARREGLVKIENADAGDETELLASCIISAQLAQTGRRQDDPQTHRVVETFVDKLSSRLSSGKDYLLFDEPIASLTEAAIRGGLFTPAKGPKGPGLWSFSLYEIQSGEGPGGVPGGPPASGGGAGEPG